MGRKHASADDLVRVCFTPPLIEMRCCSCLIRGSGEMILRKRYYILFVARDDDGRLRKIPLPLKYAYGFLAASIVGAFTIVGLAGSYTRMLLKTESYNQVRAERELPVVNSDVGISPGRGCGLRTVIAR